MLIGKSSNNYQNKFRKSTEFIVNEKRILYFTPGMFFVVLGLFALLAPRFLLLIISSLLVFLGGLFCFLAWKFVTLKKRMEAMFSEVKGKVVVQGVHVVRSTDDLRSSKNHDINLHASVDPIDLKKITYH